jgi:hypothetical protein
MSIQRIIPGPILGPWKGNSQFAREPKGNTMKALLTCFLLTPFLTIGAAGASTINNVNRYAYGANIAWMDWLGDTNNGAVIGQYVCSGYIYAANVGWIHLGDGTATDGIRYGNASATDYGVNHDGVGNLRGYAYGANIGWVNFENQGEPKLNLLTGKLSGFVYGANIGWISLSNAQAFVQTDVIARGPDSDGDSIADPWELEHAGNLVTMNGTSDSDGDGVSDYREYGADTDPMDASDYFRITAIAFNAPTETVTMSWLSQPTRLYKIKYRSTLDAGSSWTDSALGLILPDTGTTTTRSFLDAGASQRFFIVEAICPLMD